MKAFIIQARVGSTRLPNKILLPFHGGNTILDVVIDKLKSFNLPIILATSYNEANDVLESVSNKHNIYFFRGDENDVLNRFIGAAEYFNVDEIIRVCSDNPLLDTLAIQHLLDAASSKFDYVSFNVGGIPSIKTHFGFWTEYVTLKALRLVRELTSERLFHEHVTNYVYSHPEIFRINWLTVDDEICSKDYIRTTIDTVEDFDTIRRMYAHLHDNNSLSIKGVIEYVDLNGWVADNMKSQILINSK